MVSDDGELTPRRVPVLHGLPELVTRTLQKHYYAGVKEAEDRFEYNAAEEDSLTGDLGGCLTEPEPIAIGADGHSFLWQATVHKIRGRGAGAPERRYGADGIFQLEVRGLRAQYLVRKGLLFQAKKVWTGRDRRLLEQTRNLLEYSSSSIVIDYSARGYRAIPGVAVVQAGGDRSAIAPEDDQSLAKVLGDQFVACTRGENGLYWDRQSEQIMTAFDRRSEMVPEYVIGMDVQQIG